MSTAPRTTLAAFLTSRSSRRPGWGCRPETPFVNDSKVLSESATNFLLMMLFVVVRAHFVMGRCRWGYANLHSVLGFGNDIMKFNTYPSLSY